MTKARHARSRVVMMLFLCTWINYMDRTVMSITIVPMAEEFGWSVDQKSLVLSSFFYGYVLSQIVGGFLATIYGGHIILGYGCALWSIFTLLTAFSPSQSSMLPLLLVRFFVGISEAVAFPVAYHLINFWFPANEKSRAISLMVSGSCLGTVTSLYFIPRWCSEYGWRYPLIVLSSLGILWVFVWFALIPDDKAVLDEEARDQETDFVSPVQHSEPRGLDLRNRFPGIVRIVTRYLTNRPCNAIMAAQFAHGWGHYVLLMWTPTYLTTKLGLDLKTAGMYSMLPYVVMFVFSNLGGWMADTFIRSGMTLTKVRKLVETISYVGAILGFVLLAQAQTPVQGVILLAFTLGSMAVSTGGHSANVMDVAPNSSGMLQGVCNTLATIPGMVAVPISGRLYSSYSWSYVFYLAALIYCFALAYYVTFASARDQSFLTILSGEGTKGSAAVPDNGVELGDLDSVCLEGHRSVTPDEGPKENCSDGQRERKKEPCR